MTKIENPYHNIIIHRINNYIKDIELDLNGVNVLTEVGSDLYNYKPIIALMAGAKNVMAWTRDSYYGKASKLISDCKKKERELGHKNCIEFFNGDLNQNHLMQADIITNSGFLRPLNKNKLRFTQENVVIPLMYEKWEFRDKDIDIDYCRKNSIKVSGINEHNEKFNIFNHNGPLAAKMVFEAGYGLLGNKMIIWSDDAFGDVIVNFFKQFNPKSIIKTTNYEVVKEHIIETDFIFIANYNEKRSFTSNDNDFFNLEELSIINPFFGIIHLFGNLNYEKLKKMSIPCYPKKNGRAQNMSFNLNHVGINPFISLIVSGLKVGQCMLENDYNNDLVQPICNIND